MRHLLFLAALAACGGKQNQADREAQAFACRDRSATYVAIKHLAGEELGVHIDCENGPHIKRWRKDKAGPKVEDDHPITPVAFDKAWKEIEGTGWQNLKDCSNGSLEKADPVYEFDIKDDSSKSTFKCQTREVPYPYNDITDALDVLAQKGRGQLGDDEPPEAKALDKKDKQR